MEKTTLGKYILLFDIPEIGKYKPPQKIALLHVCNKIHIWVALCIYISISLTYFSTYFS